MGAEGLEKRHGEKTSASRTNSTCGPRGAKKGAQTSRLEKVQQGDAERRKKKTSKLERAGGN